MSGSFSDFEIELNYDPENLAASSVAAKIKIDSIDTGNERRDNHLRSADFFDAESFPYMTFTSSSIEAVADDEFVAKGTLTIKDKTREIELPVKLLGTQAIAEEMQAMFGGTKEVASFSAATAVDRGDYGVGVGNWAATLVIGAEVEIKILVEAHRK